MFLDSKFSYENINLYKLCHKTSELFILYLPIKLLFAFCFNKNSGFFCHIKTFCIQFYFETHNDKKMYNKIK